ncbi:hypothetical protein CAC42_7681 [Sphaceloma murrayae]|uniref:AAA+ ATPase domain-containing protein n=1 Tax=Sphaceloma murrayae TaxID=2082308 RepID=A0A2K1QXD7_9PEZI|nr:hypothetical protein CAC42_7681 [Sphaceloma murrayae]
MTDALTSVLDVNFTGMPHTARRPSRRYSTSSTDCSTDSLANASPAALLMSPLPDQHAVLPDVRALATDPCEIGMKVSSKEYYRSKPTALWKPWTPGQEAAARLATNEIQQHALIVKREMDSEGLSGIKLYSVDVQSPLIKEVIAKVFKGYRGLNTNLASLRFKAPFHELVHRWDQLTEAAAEVTDEVAKQHVELFRTIVEPEILPIVEKSKDLIKNKIISFDTLWALYEPGTIVILEEDRKERALLVDQGMITGAGNEQVYVLSGVYVDNDGVQYGTVVARIKVPMFQGTQPIANLPIQPLCLKDNPDAIRERLVARGKEWQAFMGSHHKAYTGTYLRPVRNSSAVKEFVENGRIVVDAEMYGNYSHALLPPLGALSQLDAADPKKTIDDRGHESLVEYMPPMPMLGSHHHLNGANLRRKKHKTISSDAITVKDKLEPVQLGDDQLLLCTNELRGYCLTKKHWVTFHMENIHEIRWNEDAFPSLVLPAQDKDILYAFADSQINHSNTFDDVIEGKGQGIIILLSGPPGVGKTLTAESIAEEMKRPLYAVSSAELGDMSVDIEAALRDVLEICARWDAVLLLDECDVFLAERNKHDIYRNKMVSVFLRQLEYHKGVLFLTTNRHADFDPAFASRIDLALEYAPLEQSSRKTIWTTFLTRQAKRGDGPGTEIGQAQIEDLAKLELNGREIKNVVKSAYLLAAREKRALAIGDVNKVLRVRVPKEKMAGHHMYS